MERLMDVPPADKDFSLSGFSLMLTQPPFIIMLVEGEDFEVLYANSYAAGIFQISLSQVIGKPLFSLNSQLEEKVRETHRQVTENGTGASKGGIELVVDSPVGKAIKYFNYYVEPCGFGANGKERQVVYAVDVTEHVFASRRSGEIAQQFQDLFKHAPVGIVLYHGEDFIVEQANNQALAMWGKTLDQVQGRKMKEIFPEIEVDEKIRNRFDEGVQHFMKGETYVVIEEPLSFIRNGQLHMGWFNYTHEPVRDSDGNLAGILAVAVDVTSQVLAKRKLEHEQVELFNLAHAMPQLVWMAGSDGKVSFYNDRVSLFAGAKKGEDGHWSWQGLLHPDDLAPTDTAWNTAVTTGTVYEKEHRVLMKDGTYRWHLSRAFPVKNENNEIIKWYGTATDIHEIRITQHRVEHNEQRLRMVIEATGAAFFDYDINTKELFWSDQLKVFCGYDPSEIITPEKVYAVIYPEDREELLKKTAEAHMPDSDGRLSHEHRIINQKDGTIRWIHARSQTYFETANGKMVPVRIAGIATDITTQKHAEEALKKNEAELEKLVMERTRELQRSNEDLQQFAHVTSHDLKEPIRKIKTFASRLEFEKSSQLDEKAKVYLEKVHSAADRMIQMIDGVLHYSMMTGSGDPQEDSVELNKVISAIKVDLELTLQQKQATLTYKDLPTVKGNHLSIYQLFYNLVINSIKFAKADASPIISIYVDPDAKGLSDGFVRVIIQDNGIGFPQEYATYIFDTFTRLHSKDKYEGTGLGLAMCKKIAERNGGSIEAFGIPGEGATFLVTLRI